MHGPCPVSRNEVDWMPSSQYGSRSVRSRSGFRHDSHRPDEAVTKIQAAHREIPHAAGSLVCYMHRPEPISDFDLGESTGDADSERLC